VRSSKDCGGTALEEGAEAFVDFEAGRSSRALLDDRGIE
jgi:hypothetical protein